MLALIFPAGGLVLFIPWRLAAERGADFSYLALGGGAGSRAQVWGRAQREAVATALVWLCGVCALEKSGRKNQLARSRNPLKDWWAHKDSNLGPAD